MGRELNNINGKIQHMVKGEITCSEWHSSILLDGMVEKWEEVITAGKIAANKGYKGVVNRIQVKNLTIPDIRKPAIKDGALNNRHVDVLIIGAGIIGSAIAREMSKWDISILLVDKEEDIGVHATSRNDGMVHPGIEPKPGTKKAYYNVRGNRLYTKIVEELDVSMRRSGSNILYESKWARLLIPFVKARARANGVDGISFLSRKEAIELEPHITDKIAGAVHFSSTAVLSPYKMAIAYAENAVMNGVEISLETAVIGMKNEGNNILEVYTNRGIVHPRIVINAAGAYADKVAYMAGDQFFTIHPRKGHLIFLDKKKGRYISSVISKPSLTAIKGDTKGGGIVKTIDGNILIGPDSCEQPFREDYSTNACNIKNILEKHLAVVPELSQADIISYCAGIRAATYEEDFIVEKSEYVDNLVYAAGIQSPGLASAPAIAEDIEKITCGILSELIDLKLKSNFRPCRKGIPDIKEMSFEERSRIIKNNPDYGIIICRCEEISRGEIIDALDSPIPVKSLDALKRRVRPGMGRCQGSFCTPLVMEIINQHKGIDTCFITKKGGMSNIVVGETKNNLEYERGGKGGGI